MSIKTRVEKLEAWRTAHTEVTLGELVLYSYSDVVDLDFERRLEHSILGRLIAAVVAAAGRNDAFRATRGLVGINRD